MAPSAISPIEQAPAPVAASATAHLTPEELGQWGTSTRLLASLLNDYLIEGTPISRNADGQLGLLLHGKNKSASSPAIWIGLSKAGLRLTKPAKYKTAAFPGDFTPPVLATTVEGAEQDGKPEFAPARLFTHIRSVLDAEPLAEEKWNTICSELTSSASNGHNWIEWYKQQKPLSLTSSMMQWEQALYTGHPMHPMHRAFSAKDPMPQIAPQNIHSLMEHSISIISVPGSDVRISGPLRQVLKPILAQYGLDNQARGKLITLCVTMQIPVIKHFHPTMEVLVKDAFRAKTQSSLRTVTIPNSDYDFKFALDVTVGSALRTISSRTICILSELSTILNEILPPNLWLMGDLGGVAGSQTDPIDDAKHISCVFRENLNRRALANNETLVVTGALQEIPPGSEECNAALLFGLNDEASKMAWFTEYTRGLIDAHVSPVLDHGVAFEAHAQNVLIRMDRSTGKINGWANRDLGSIKVHLPTLKKSGYEIFSIVEGTLVPTYSEMETWRIIQFCLIENHINIFIYRLGLSRPEAWRMVRSVLLDFLDGRKHLENEKGFREMLFAEEIQLKAFMIMKFAGKARVYDYVMVGNVLLEGETEEEKASRLARGTTENGTGTKLAEILNGNVEHEAMANGNGVVPVNGVTVNGNGNTNGVPKKGLADQAVDTVVSTLA